MTIRLMQSLDWTCHERRELECSTSLWTLRAWDSASGTVFKIKINIFGYFEPKNIFSDNENK